MLPRRRISRSPTLPPEISADRAPIPLTEDRLRLCASWIRDDLDPIIAREGPEILHPEDVLSLHELFIRLVADARGLAFPMHSITGYNKGGNAFGGRVTIIVLRQSRLHLAIRDIAGKATRWPGRLVDECDVLLAVWKEMFGPLELLRPLMFGTGGRLTGVSGVGDFSRTKLLRLWSLSCPDKLVPARSKKHGHLGFKPGDWWINGLYACHAGIIDLDTSGGGISHDDNGAYAVLLRDNTEIEALSADCFTYRCEPRDKGRFRLTSATSKSRFPIRVLRSHYLKSVWAPQVGIRYDGLYRVSGWSIVPCNPKENEGANVFYEIKFSREEEQKSMESVLKHPMAEEVDDYMEYRRLRQKREWEARELLLDTPAPRQRTATLPMLDIVAPIVGTALSTKDEFLTGTSYPFRTPPFLSPFGNEVSTIARMATMGSSIMLPIDEGEEDSGRSSAETSGGAFLQSIQVPKFTFWKPPPAVKLGSISKKSKTLKSPGATPTISPGLTPSSAGSTSLNLAARKTSKETEEENRRARFKSLFPLNLKTPRESPAKDGHRKPSVFAKFLDGIREAPESENHESKARKKKSRVWRFVLPRSSLHEDHLPGSCRVT